MFQVEVIALLHIKLLDSPRIMLSHKTRISILALTFLLASVFLIGDTGAQERQEIKLGAILPLTGVIAPVGEAMHRGLQMAASDAKHISA